MDGVRSVKLSNGDVTNDLKQSLLIPPQPPLDRILLSRGKRKKWISTSMTYLPPHSPPRRKRRMTRRCLGIEDISRRAQETVEDINHSRTNDQKVMDDFQEKLAEKVTETCRQMKEHMYTVYEENSDEMQVKLQELSKVLESCSKLNRELLEAAQALAFLREGLAMSQRSES
ncbi:synaptonemal complex central element protein 2 isoform X3 [Oryzias latipes]